MMNMPDVIGFTLGEASILLKKAGLSICRIQVIAPPRDTSQLYDDNYRVIKLDTIDDKNVALHICKPL
jgi:hypothetical protein